MLSVCAAKKEHPTHFLSVSLTYTDRLTAEHKRRIQMGLFDFLNNDEGDGDNECTMRVKEYGDDSVISLEWKTCNDSFSATPHSMYWASSRWAEAYINQLTHQHLSHFKRHMEMDLGIKDVFSISFVVCKNITHTADLANKKEQSSSTI